MVRSVALQIGIDADATETNSLCKPEGVVLGITRFISISATGTDKKKAGDDYTWNQIACKFSD